MKNTQKKHTMQHILKIYMLSILAVIISFAFFDLEFGAVRVQTDVLNEQTKLMERQTVAVENIARLMQERENIEHQHMREWKK